MKLYNNIELPDVYPPKDVSDEEYSELSVPYLQAPPDVIDIFVGRQLFVDDFLIESTTLTRTEHRPVKEAKNPVFSAETPWEKGEITREWEYPRPSGTNVGSGAVWYDSKAKRYKMWYGASFQGHIAYAESVDGLNFERIPNDIYEQTNVVLPRGGGFTDFTSVTLNHYPDNKANEEYIMSVYVRPEKCERVGVNVYSSADGKHWTLRAHTDGCDDTTTLFYNPFIKKWIYSIKKNGGLAGRRREYADGNTPWEGREFKNRTFWLRADERDIVHEKWKDRPELYAFDSVAYESLMIGGFTVFKGPQNGVSMSRGLPKITELHIGYSRDGFHYSRQKDRSAFIAPSENPDKWDCGYIHTNTAIFTVDDDRLTFYYTAFKGDATKLDPENELVNGMYENAAVGAAYIRRDGFASMDGNGELKTKRLCFDGEYLFVNAKAENLSAEILDENGNIIKGFEKENCIAFSGNSCKTMLQWNNAELSALKGKIIRIRFTQNSGELYAFWISKKPTGVSGGYLGGGAKNKETLKDD